MMRVLLINPPFTEYGGLEGHGGKNPPINLAYLASYARKKNPSNEITILDAEVLRFSYKDIQDHVKEIRPDVIGISSTTPVYIGVLKIAELCKSVNQNIRIVAGGIHPTVFPAECAGEANIDFVIIGEGEITFAELLDAINSNQDLSSVKGIAYKKDGKVVCNEPRSLIEDLDILPFPARDLLPNHLYEPALTKRVSTYKSTAITTARGCPYKCSFCSANVIWKQRYRFRSALNVVDEMEHCINEFGIREFGLTDELFTIREDRAREVAEEILRRKLKIAWVCMCRAGQGSLELLKLLKRSGLKEISYGIESGDETVLKKIDKKISLDDARKTIKLTHKAGIKTHASYMIGNIGETPETIRKTIDFAKELNTDIAAFFVATPMPGTEFYDQARRLGYLRGGTDWRDYSPLSKTPPALMLPGMSSEDILSWHRRAIREYHIRPRYILKKLLRIRSRVDFLNLYNGLKLFLRLHKKAG